MGTVTILTADERLSQKSGVTLLMAGPPGIGKTSSLRTLSEEQLESTLFVNVESGDLAVRDVRVASVQPRTWRERCDIAVAIGGPNPAFPATAIYSECHFNSVMRNPDLAELRERFDTVFLDSLTAMRQAGSARDLRIARKKHDFVFAPASTCAQSQHHSRCGAGEAHQ